PAPVPMEAYEPPPAEEFAREEGARPTRRYNALGILEDIPADEPVTEAPASDSGAPQEDAAPNTDDGRVVARGTPSVVGAGAVRSLGNDGGALPPGWEHTPRNQECPCGSGKKFKKCHGANL